MKKKYLLLILFFIPFLFLTSCDKNGVKPKEESAVVGPTNEENKTRLENDVEFFEFTCLEGDEFNPIVEKVREKYTYDTTNSNVIKVDESGNVTAVGEGSAKLKILRFGTWIGYIDLTVKPREKVNPNYDETLFNEFKERIQKFDSVNQFSLTNTVKVKDTTKSIYVKMIEKPFYYEMKELTGRFPKHQIIKQEGERVYSYEFDDDNKAINRNYIGKESGVDNSTLESLVNSLNFIFLKRIKI